MDLITKREDLESSDWFNELTSEMNNHLKESYKDAFDNGYTFGTYIYEPTRSKGHMGFRYPGATRGHIEVDNNMVITNIKFYDTACDLGCVACYKQSVKEAVKKFIGSKIILE